MESSMNMSVNVIGGGQAKEWPSESDGTNQDASSLASAIGSVASCVRCGETIKGALTATLCGLCADDELNAPRNTERDLTTNCLRCGTPCRLGTPDPKARAIVRASKAGFCSNCMAEHFFGSIEVLKTTIAKLGPKIFLNAEWRENVLRPVMHRLLAHTQMPEDSINWIEVVSNWGMPWPKGHEPKEMQ